MGSGDSPGLQNRCRATPSSWVGSTPTRFRQFIFSTEASPRPTRVFGQFGLRSATAGVGKTDWLVCALLGNLQPNMVFPGRRESFLVIKTLFDLGDLLDVLASLIDHFAEPDRACANKRR
jgi:hypothetical protein